ncbi:hypothetical protein L6452_33264 [Arctium lappa]|uniref:Uncharacterized protein n=1 Tax=Arctium lappa TaxID=4217 RepID=A0ACB8Z837_ARCLA|nr:hypothetical protein L6452_33264 [Arctium lappa]
MDLLGGTSRKEGFVSEIDNPPLVLANPDCCDQDQCANIFVSSLRDTSGYEKGKEASCSCSNVSARFIPLKMAILERLIEDDSPNPDTLAYTFLSSCNLKH